jgi:hypothetical protein
MNRRRFLKAALLAAAAPAALPPLVRPLCRMPVAYAAGARHGAFYPGALPVEKHATELAEYDTSRGTVRFDAERPLPAALVRRLVATRLAERAGRRARKG